MSRSPDRDHSPRRAGSTRDTARQQGALARFRHRLASGDYDAVVGKGLRQALHDAAADTSLEAEIGALRLALLRLLNEERDPLRLAAGVSRITRVAAQAARLRNGPDDGLNEFRAAFQHELVAISREFAQGKSPQPEIYRPDLYP